MAFRSVELDEKDLESGFRSFERFSAIGDKYTGVWLRTEKKTKTFKVEEGPKEVSIHVLWWPGGRRSPGGEERPAEEYEITGSWGLDKAIEKARKSVSDGGLGLRDNAGHLVRLTYARDLPTSNGNARMFKVEGDTDYAQSPTAKLPPGFKHAKPLQGNQGAGVGGGGGSGGYTQQRGGGQQSQSRYDDYGPPQATQDDDIPF